MSYISKPKHNNKRDEGKDYAFTEIYKSKYPSYMSRVGFRGNMVLLSLSSIYIFCELLNPLYINSYHSYVLCVTITFGWGMLVKINNIFNRMVKKIELSADKRTIRISFTEYLSIPKEITISINSITDFHSANLEGYYGFKLVETHKKIYYINISKNALLRYNDTIMKILSKGSSNL